MTLILLTVKRKIDSPKNPRPWPIFFMDVSKQIFSSGLLHLYNIIAAKALSENDMKKKGAASE